MSINQKFDASLETSLQQIRLKLWEFLKENYDGSTPKDKERFMRQVMSTQNGQFKYQPTGVGILLEFQRHLTKRYKPYKSLDKALEDIGLDRLSIFCSFYTNEIKVKVTHDKLGLYLAW